MEENNLPAEVIIDIIKPKAPQKTSLYPVKDLDFHDQGVRVSESLITKPLDMGWITNDEFAKYVEDFGNSLQKKTGTKANRKVVRTQINTLISEMKEASGFVKSYIKERVDRDNPSAYYDEFGMIKGSRTHLWPTSYDETKQALAMIIPALHKYKLNDSFHGKKYWTNMQTKFLALELDTTVKAGSISISTSAKNILRGKIHQGFKSIVKITEGQNPDNWKALLRERGFLKERN